MAKEETQCDRHTIGDTIKRKGTNPTTDQASGTVVKVTHQAIQDVKKLKNGCEMSLLWYIRRVKGTKQTLRLYCKGVPTGDSSATAATNAKRTRTVQHSTVLTYGVKKK